MAGSCGIEDSLLVFTASSQHLKHVLSCLQSALGFACTSTETKCVTYSPKLLGVNT